MKIKTKRRKNKKKHEIYYLHTDTKEGRKAIQIESERAVSVY